MLSLLATADCGLFPMWIVSIVPWKRGRRLTSSQSLSVAEFLGWANAIIESGLEQECDNVEGWGAHLEIWV